MQAMATASGNENVLTVIESTYTKPKDLSAFADNEEAYIQFWLYVEDAACLQPHNGCLFGIQQRRRMELPGVPL